MVEYQMLLDESGNFDTDEPQKPDYKLLITSVAFRSDRLSNKKRTVEWLKQLHACEDVGHPQRFANNVDRVLQQLENLQARVIYHAFPAGAFQTKGHSGQPQAIWTEAIVSTVTPMLPYVANRDVSLHIIVEERGFRNSTGSLATPDPENIGNQIIIKAKKVLYQCSRSDLAGSISPNDVKFEVKNQEQCPHLGLADYSCFIVSRIENWNLISEQSPSKQHFRQKRWQQWWDRLSPHEVT